MAGEVIVWAQPSLLDLLRGIGGIELIPLHDGTPDTAYDADIEIMELQHFFRTTIDTIPREVPYMHASRAQLPESSRRKVGLAWRAGDWNPERNNDLRLFEPMLARDDIAVYALQIDVRPEECDPRIIFDESRLTVTGTAELMRALDLIITIDSMPAHLGGAPGIPTWTLLPHDCDWRWMNDRVDSPWYPTMRLFRQRVPGDWRSVIEDAAALLYANGRALPRLAKAGSHSAGRR